MPALRRNAALILTLLCLLAFLAPDAWAGPAVRRQQAPNALVVSLLALAWAAAVSLAGVALLVAYRATFPRRAEQVVQAAARAPIRCFILGLVNGGLLFVLAAATGEAAWPVSFVALAVLGWLVFLGLAAKAEGLGVRIARASGRECSPIMGLVIGWPTIVCMQLALAVGWVVLAYLTLSGIGAAVLSFFKTQTKEEPDAGE